jgi:glyoxylase-like metal-dependent hydrolase (beta-lactamase superfamily II)
VADSLAKEQRRMGRLHVQIIQVTPLLQNCALIWDEESKQGAITDPGGDVPAILAAVEKTGVDVQALYVTHCHPDHAGGAADLAAALCVPIYGPDRRDEPLMLDFPKFSERFGMTAKAFTPEKWLSEGATFSIGGHVFEAVHCPGHTPGHLVFVNHDARFAIVGDVLFRHSVGRTDLPYGDHAALISAITNKLLPLGDDFSFICGHGKGSTFGIERQTNPFLARGPQSAFLAG